MKKLKVVILTMLVLSFMCVNVVSNAKSTKVYDIVDKEYKLGDSDFSVTMYGNSVFHYSQPHTLDTAANYLVVYVSPNSEVLESNSDFEESDVNIKISYPKYLKAVQHTESQYYADCELKVVKRKAVAKDYIKVTLVKDGEKYTKKIKIQVVK